MSLSGNLSQIPLADVLRSIEQARRSGCLTITRGPLRAEIYFDNGQWLAVERVPVGPPIAQQFVELGFITPEQFEDIARVPYVQAAIVSDADTVDMLMQAGLLTQEQLRFWALNDAVALVQVVRMWPDGGLSFQDGAPVPPELVPVPLPVGQVISWSQSAQTADQNLGTEAVMDFTEIGDDGSLVAVTPNEWRMLTLVDGKLPLWAIAEMLQAPEPAIVTTAQGLVERGLLVVVGRVSAGGAPAA